MLSSLEWTMLTVARACGLCPGTVQVSNAYRGWSLWALSRCGESLCRLASLDNVCLSQTGQSQDDGG